MSLSNKKSREITIDGIKYRYQVSTTKLDEKFNFTLNLTVQCSESEGAVLQVKGLITRNVWLDFLESNVLDRSLYPIILPRHIHVIVNMAINYGWRYQVAGKPFIINTNNVEFFRT
ncbi:hypothetical protein ACN5ZZ_004711 [Vibrio parahaemolyticus]|nr:hypothetical protein [Vibrio parahaemolyticus]